jgi:hypothetical protein
VHRTILAQGRRLAAGLPWWQIAAEIASSR